MKKPSISVILTSFNHEKYICEAIDSALNQTFTDFELIIVDDASVDGSWELIRHYTDPRIKAFRNDEQKRGIWGINKAVTEIALGEYIAIHHSDDVWESNKLEKQLAFIETHSEIGAVFSNALAITENGSPLADEKHFYFNIFGQQNKTRLDWLRHFFTHGNALCHPSVLIRKTCYQECGLYRYGLAQLGDFDMWIRLCMKYEIHIMPEKLIRFRVLDNERNTSGDRPETRVRGRYEFYKLLQNYRSIKELDDLKRIFPESAEYYSDNEFDVDYILAMVALEINSNTAMKLFGLDLLFEIISDVNRARIIKRVYDFDYIKFIGLTSTYDIFSYEELEELNDKVTTLNQMVMIRDEQIIRISSERDQVLKSTSWKITKPLRKIRSLLSRGKAID